VVTLYVLILNVFNIYIFFSYIYIFFKILFLIYNYYEFRSRYYLLLSLLKGISSIESELRAEIKGFG